MSLTNATNGASIGATNLATLMIVDDDGPRHFRFALLNPTVLENGTNYNVVVLRTNGFTAGDGTVRVTLTTIDGSAVSPADYVALTTTLDFVNGQTSMTVPILIVDNSVVAGNKLLTLTLSGATDGAGILTPSTTLTIVDNDPIAGSPDGSFNPGTGSNAAVQALARTAPASWSSAATSPVRRHRSDECGAPAGQRRAG